MSVYTLFSSTTFKSACEMEAVYRRMETDTLTSRKYCEFEGHRIAIARCRAASNPNIQFVDGMV